MEPSPVGYGSAKMARNLAVFILTMQTVTARGPRENSGTTAQGEVINAGPNSRVLASPARLTHSIQRFRNAQLINVTGAHSHSHSQLAQNSASIPPQWRWQGPHLRSLQEIGRRGVGHQSAQAC
eukprot:6938299-Prymnesium_polylepis.1